MYNKLLIQITNNKDLFSPLIFTPKQISIILKIQNQNTLSNAEKKSYYSSIKKKLLAINLLIKNQNSNEYFIAGNKHIIKERIKEAQKIINEFSHKYGKIFVSGSFLFSKKYNDIDLFIIRKKGHKEEYKGNLHIIYLSEKQLKKPIFQSASLISISTFPIINKLDYKRPKLNEIMSLYHESIIEIMKNEKKSESLRNLIFNYNLFVKNKLLNAIKLNTEISNINLKKIDIITKKLLQKLFSKSYLYVDIHDYIKTLNNSIESIKPNIHLIRYKNTYEELINECRKNKAKTY
ncbi:hypothetical protein HOD20_03585 [archaeon]|jgi:hypothetical protein|nr:hypothetical protein [archaeon]MBT4351583.1 hypothetical protein [archaeon]MBT4648340.1 hypothetical protein [archaeon]MBT6822329.1 hypothetical protein [archaeon]MBT7392810.1 hypothetical protein [archaeon]